MIGFFLCLPCGVTHDEWFHGEKLMICDRCKSRESIRYNTPTKSFIVAGVEMISWTFPPEFYDLTRECVQGNPFDIQEVKRSCVRHPDLFIQLSKDIDSYIRFAYFDFRDPQIVYDRFLMREP